MGLWRHLRTYQKSINGSISLFGVPFSHSLAGGSNSSCGNLVSSSFFLVKSRYFDDTWRKVSNQPSALFRCSSHVFYTA